MSEFDLRNRNTDDLSSRLYHEVISSRMRPFRDGVQGLPRLVRDLARQMGKKAQLEIQGETTEVDRDILERLDAPLNHLVRNALDHGLETPEERSGRGKTRDRPAYDRGCPSRRTAFYYRIRRRPGDRRGAASSARLSSAGLPAATWPTSSAKPNSWIFFFCPDFPPPPR